MKLRYLILVCLIIVLGACTDYDHDTPDTSANRAGFERHFDFTPPPDVTELYYFADELGADVLYQLGFSASPETVNRIVTTLDLETTAPDVDATSLPYDFPWWDAAAIDEATLYWKCNADADYYWMLWYHAETGRVYYLEYSL
jgi:hypothetical protein